MFKCQNSTLYIQRFQNGLWTSRFSSSQQWTTVLHPRQSLITTNVKKWRVYCAFIDYSNAFDMIDRASLWMKLLKHGVNGKVLNVIYNMYQNAKSCVQNCNQNSNIFSCNIGVRQGENLSPVLFAIYLNDLKRIHECNISGTGVIRWWYSKRAGAISASACFTLCRWYDNFSRNCRRPPTSIKWPQFLLPKWSLKTNISKTKLWFSQQEKSDNFPIFSWVQKKLRSRMIIYI